MSRVKGDSYIKAPIVITFKKSNRSNAKILKKIIRNRNIDEVLDRYKDTLKPMHQQFIEPTKNFADIIIPNDRYNTVAIDIVRTVISERL